MLIGLSGCDSKSGLDKAIVKGKVTYQGITLENGRVRFSPTGETRGQANIAFIEKGGEFVVTARGGLQVGTHRVEVFSYRNVPGAKPYTAEQVDGHPELKVGDIPQEQFIPAKFNKNSQLEIKIEPGNAEIIKDINLS